MNVFLMNVESYGCDLASVGVLSTNRKLSSVDGGISPYSRLVWSYSRSYTVFRFDATFHLTVSACHLARESM